MEDQRKSDRKSRKTGLVRLSTSETEDDEEETAPPPRLSGEPLPVRKSSEEFIKKFGPLSVEVQQALTAVLLLDSPEKNIVVDSLNALQKFLKKCDENKELYVEMGGLPPVHKKMFEPNPVIQRMAMKILAMTSIVHKAKLYMRDMQLVKDLLVLSRVEDDVIVEYSTYTMSHLATLHTGRIQLLQHDCLPILIDLLSHPDPDIQRNSLETVWQISADPLQVGTLITNIEYCEKILKLVESEYPPLQAIALLTLEKIASHPEGIPALESIDTFNILANKLTDEANTDLHRYCLRVLFHGCRDRGTCKKYAYLVPTVAAIVERTLDTATKVNGLELLGRFCSVEQVSKNVAQCGIPQLVHHNLKATDARLKEACAFAIAQITRSAFLAKKEFAKSIPILLEMIHTPGTSERGLKCALFAVSSIVEDTANSAREFIQALGLDTYRKLLEKYEHNSVDVVLSALCTIDIIAASHNDRPELVQSGFLPVLLMLLQNAKDPQIYASVCIIIANILSDPVTHEDLRSVKLPEAILSIISTEEEAVVEATVPIIKIACSDPNSPLMKTLLDMGLLQTMGNRTDLLSHGALRACFDQLVSANCTLKYGIVGHVSPHEKLETGFCDVGGIKHLEELKLPRDYKWEGENTQQSILLLDSGKGTLDEVVMKNNPSLKEKSNINDLIEAVKTEKKTLETETALVETIAKRVSDRFGGPLDNWRLTAKAEDIEIKNIQNHYRSVIVPVSSLTTGAYRSRALVFKTVCDAVGIPCSLETSDYKKTWNVVLLRPETQETVTELCACTTDTKTNELSDESFSYTDHLRKFVVDLVFQPGTLIPLGSFEAEAYITAH